MRTFIGVSLLTGVLLSPGVAVAGSCPSSGVHVDQGSPAAKQYGFPVAGARGETSGSGNCSGKHHSSGSSNPPLFGAGVTPHATSTKIATTSTSTTSTSTTSTTATTTPTAPKAKVAAVAAHKKRAQHRKQAAVASHTTSKPPPAKPVSASLASHVTPAAATSNGGSSAWIALVGGGLLVLILGTGAGLALKRRL
jgi:hypothetical protein